MKCSVNSSLIACVSEHDVRSNSYKYSLHCPTKEEKHHMQA